MQWRVGSKVPLNVYEGDVPVCQCHTAEYAGRIVAAMNAVAPAPTAEPIFPNVPMDFSGVSDGIVRDLTPGNPFPPIHCECGETWTQEIYTVCPKCSRWPKGPCCFNHATTKQRRFMIVCATCGFKRCPHATDHSFACTGSNDGGQDGSRFSAVAPADPEPAREWRVAWNDGDFGACEDEEDANRKLTMLPGEGVKQYSLDHGLTWQEIVDDK